jgi:radical SAM superfamily enzyme YgiQ (UPF0313 family)
MGRNFRTRSVENIKMELRQLSNDYGIQWIRFPDDNLMLNKKWFNEFLDMMITTGLKWTCLARADDLTEDIVRKMRSARCQEIFFGVESGSQMLLNKMNKNIKVEKNINAIKICKEVGIKSCAYMMFGFPGEDEKTINETIQFLENTNPDKSRISQFLPIPGSDVYFHPEKYNIQIKFDPDNFWYFDDHNFCLKYLYITNEEMSKLRNLFHGSFDLSKTETLFMKLFKTIFCWSNDILLGTGSTANTE